MIDVNQIREDVIRPTLINVGLYSSGAEELLVATMAHESDGGKYLVQIGGPALGLYGCEPRTHDSLWKNYLSQNKSLARNILDICHYNNIPEAREMVWNLQYATLICRAYYRSFPDPMPSEKDINAIYDLYKKRWNTSKGEAHRDQFVKDYMQYTRIVLK